MKRRPIAKSESAAQDASLSFSKKTQLGASGAVVGAIIGGPIGAVVGGIVGTAFGAAAEVSPAPKNSKLDRTLLVLPPDKPARAGSKRKKSNARRRAKGAKTKTLRARVRRR